jgi:RNA repair, ligase-Pnkp-associating, region of Hen1
MLLTIATTREPATDLGYLLHKNPGRAHSARPSFGTAHLFFPQASPQRCCAALLLDVDPVGLVRDGTGPASSRWAATSTTGPTRRPRSCPPRWPSCSARR